MLLNITFRMKFKRRIKNINKSNNILYYIYTIIYEKVLTTIYKYIVTANPWSKHHISSVQMEKQKMKLIKKYFYTCEKLFEEQILNEYKQ